MVLNRSDCDSVESVENYSVRAVVVRVATSMVFVALDAMNASEAMDLAVDSIRAVDKPFFVNPNLKYRNRPDVLPI